MRVGLSFRRLRRWFSNTFLCLTAIWASGCGLLGDKKSPSRTIAQENSACLDRLGGLVNDFMDGEASESEWTSSWNCVDDTLDTFAKFVKPGSEQGYTRVDVQALMQKFIFSRKTVKPDLVEGLFYVKSTLLGGDYEHISKDQINRVRTLVKLVRDEGIRLLPHLYNRKNHPTSDQLRALADAFEAFGQKLNKEISPDPTKQISKDALVKLLRGLAEVSPGKDPSKVVDPEKVAAWGGFLAEAKTLVVRGPDAAVNGDDVKNILDLGLKLGGPLLAFLAVEVDDPDFLNEMVDRIGTALNGSIARWGSELPFSQFEKIIAAAPVGVLPTRAEEFRAAALGLLKPRKKQMPDGSIVTYRSAASRLTLSKSETGVDKNSIEALKALYKKGSRANAHLNRMWVSAADYLTIPQFEAMANSYKNGLSSAEAAEVERLKTIAKRYFGLFPKDTNNKSREKQMDFTFTNWDLRSLNNINRFSWFESVGELILKAYGSTSNAYGPAGTVDDLLVLTDDLRPLLNAISMVHPDTKNVHEKRFREANLFMPNGNGDLLMDVPETAMYLGFLKSIGHRANFMADELWTVTKRCAQTGFDPKVQLPAYDIKCFRDEFFTKSYRALWNTFPGLIAEYETYNASQKARFAYAFEAAAKIPTYNEDPVTEFDLSSFSGIPHYVEGVMQKYDANKDNVFDRNEILHQVFPVFKNELKKLSGMKIDLGNQALLLWLMQKGKSPFKCKTKKTAQEWLDLVAWLVTGGPFKGFTANRLNIYEIFATLGMPDPPGCPSTTAAASANAVSGMSTNANYEAWSQYEDILEYLPSQL